MYTSGIVDDVTFLHNGQNGPETKTTRNVSSSSAGGGTGAKLLFTIASLFTDELVSRSFTWKTDWIQCPWNLCD